MIPINASFHTPQQHPVAMSTRPRLARNGPYDILLDCANVAFYGQNRAGGGFNWGQVMRMVDKVKRSHPDKRLLVVRSGDGDIFVPGAVGWAEWGRKS